MERLEEARTRRSDLDRASVRVAIVEDNPQLRDGLAYLIDGTRGYSCVGAYTDCERMLQELDTALPDVVLMDIGLPGMSGIEGIQRLKNRMPEVEVLVLTVFEDEKKIFDALVAGASGYLLKKTPASMILESIREIYEGGAPLSGSIARKMLTFFQQLPPTEAIGDDLSERELQVLAGLVLGQSYKLIAHDHGISLNTVRSHVRHIYEKLHVNSKGQAISVAVRHKLV